MWLSVPSAPEAWIAFMKTIAVAMIKHGVKVAEHPPRRDDGREGPFRQQRAQKRRQSESKA